MLEFKYIQAKEKERGVGEGVKEGGREKGEVGWNRNTSLTTNTQQLQ